MNDNYFITAIGTDVGKTFVSAIMVSALNYDYWKPIQCGSLDFTDTDFIRKNTNAKVFQERYKFALAASPHIAAKNENIEISLNDFEPPSSNNLIIEGAGGILVPINYSGTPIIQLASKWNTKVILVVNFYLGSINHTLLSIEYLVQNKISIAAIVMNGEINISSAEVVKNTYPNLKFIHVRQLKENVENDFQKIVHEFKSQWNELVG